MCFVDAYVFFSALTQARKTAPSAYPTLRKAFDADLLVDAESDHGINEIFVDHLE
jgi:hypothetical protein